MKILESSQTLLHVLKRETVNLTKLLGEERSLNWAGVARKKGEGQ